MSMSPRSIALCVLLPIMSAACGGGSGGTTTAPTGATTVAPENPRSGTSVGACGFSIPQEQTAISVEPGGATLTVQVTVTEAGCGWTAVVTAGNAFVTI